MSSIATHPCERSADLAALRPLIRQIARRIRRRLPPSVGMDEFWGHDADDLASLDEYADPLRSVQLRQRQASGNRACRAWRRTSSRS
jgi:hypothetical protein